MLPRLKRGGVCVTCGCLAGDTEMLSFIPFIKRGIRLCGVDSRFLIKDERTTIWKRLESDINEELFHDDEKFLEIRLEQVQAIAGKKILGTPIGMAVTVNMQRE